MDSDAADIAYFADRALDGMVAILQELGDDKANQAPNLPGANSAFVVLTHCLGVMNYWGGYVAIGREIERDRDAEFRARGRVQELVPHVAAARAQLHRDLALATLSDPVANMPPEPYDSPRPELLQGTVFLHILEELAQHHGHMELTRDLLIADESQQANGWISRPVLQSAESASDR
jgi:hypothetical protein